MKIRSGFVSNSSSSSFCIYGVVLKSTEIPENKKNKWAEPIIGELEFHHCYEDDIYYIGRPWCDIKDNETGAEFRKSVEDTLEKELRKKFICKTYTETIYDG